MKKFLLLAIVTLAMLNSCKEDDREIIFKDAGSISVQLNDANGAAIANAPLALSINNTEEGTIHEATTDANGHVLFSKINAGSYTIFGSEIQDGEMAFNVAKTTHLVASASSQVKIVPSDFNATYKFTLKERTMDDQVIPLGSDVKVAMVKYSANYYEYGPPQSFEFRKEDIIKEIAADGTTTEFVFENMPLMKYYYLIYTDSEFYVKYSLRSVPKTDETVTKTRTIGSTRIRKYELDHDFVVHKSANVPYEGCKLLILSNEAYYGLDEVMNYDQVAAAAHASAVTDVNGKATAKVTVYSSLYVMCFAPDNTFLKRTSFGQIGNAPLHISLER